MTLKKFTFLWLAIISSRKIALNIVCTLKLGWVKQRAVAMILAVRGPDIPMSVNSSWRLGVSLKGTGLLESSSPKEIRKILLSLRIDIISFNQPISQNSFTHSCTSM